MARLHVDNVEEGSTKSSTGSNNPLVMDDEELSDDASSNPYKQTVCYISKQSDENPKNQLFKCQNQKLIPYGTTADRPIKRKYRPKIICDALLQCKIDRGTLFKAYDLLANTIKEAWLFFGLPPKLCIGWLMQKISGKKNTNMDQKETSNKKRKNDCVFEPRKYTSRMIIDALSTYPFSQGAFLEAYDLLINDINEVEFFFGLPPKLCMAWVMKRIPKEVEKESWNKKRKYIYVEEGFSNKKRKNDRYLERDLK